MLRVIATLAIASMAAAEWTNVARAPKDMAMGVTIALNRNNLDFAAKDLDQVSDPDHPRYTDYRSLDELTAYTRPSEASFQRVLSHIDTHNVIYSVNARTGLVLLQSTVGDVEAIFNTEVYSKMNSETNQVAVRADDLTIPAEIAADVEAVFGVTGLPLPPRGAKIVNAPDFAQVTPDVINAAYKISGVTPTGDDTNRQAIAEFQGQLLSQDDLTTFFQKFLPSDSGDDKVYAYKGDKQQGEGVEANLDIQYIMGVAPGVKTEAWQYAGMDFCADLKQWTQEIIADSNGPNVHSVSYGWQGPLDQIGCSTSQVASIDNDFMTISASGVSIIFASGDSGSGYTAGQLYSSWPAASQYVTAVGATGFVSGSSGQEGASTQFGSGGGFSRVITPAPAWQSAAISTFNSEETKLPPASVYGKGGRGTPDVAALGEGFQVVIGGNVESVGGTSASAPTFAGIVSLLNEARIQAGKKSLGLLNKFLYKNAGAAFNDITVGSNRISRGGTTVPDGFDCEAGWDPVTGWGTVDFPKLLKAAMQEA